MHRPAQPRYFRVIRDIAKLDWDALGRADLHAAAFAYYYFSVQFRESLETALALHPQDALLRALHEGECATDNLSPYPRVAAPGERMNHDEFMRRTVLLAGISQAETDRIARLGEAYLAISRAQPEAARAASIASYEDGGLETVFRAFLRAPEWSGHALGAFRHFLTEHIRFDSDPDHGHGALSRHLAPDDSVLPLWAAFHDLLVAAVPALAVTARQAVMA